MAPILHCVRHAQGYHNLGPEYHGLQDPILTPLGEEQCLALKMKQFQDQSKLALVTASPLSRTLQTAYLTFEPALKNGYAKPQILALPDAQEISALPCDTGLDVADLRNRCEERQWPVDMHLVNEGWNVKSLNNRYSPASSAIEIRARDARRLIRQKMQELIAQGNDDPEVVFVAHGGYMHFFTGDWENCNKLLGTGWENCETRAYAFEAGVDSDDGDARLVETMASRTSRGLDHPMFDVDKQKGLYAKGMNDWETQGLPNASKIGHEEVVIGRESQEPEMGTNLVRTESNPVKVAA